MSFIAAVLFTVFVARTRSHYGWTSLPIPGLLITSLTFPTVFIGSILVCNLICNNLILHELIQIELRRGSFNVNPLHPDRCGGLRSLSDYSLKTAYLAAVLSVMVGLIELQIIMSGRTPPLYVHLTIPLTVILSFICFFGPLLTAHKGMRQAKDSLLQDIAKQFSLEYDEIHASLLGNAEALSNGTEKIKSLREFYSLTDSFPVWPFDTRNSQRFIVSILGPLIPTIYTVMTKVALPG